MPPPVRNSTVSPRTFQCGGGLSSAMSLMSSKKTVRSPGMKSILVDFNSGWPPAAPAAAGWELAPAGGAVADAAGGFEAAAGRAGTFGLRLARAGPLVDFADSRSEDHTSELQS